MNDSSSGDEEQGGRRRRSSLFEDVQQKLRSHFMSTLALCSSVLTMFYLLMSVFPYSGFMVMHLVPGANHENAGLYAGFLTSSFMIGRAFSAYPFGKVADIYGRKFVLVISLFVSGIGSVAFGLSTSYSMAVIVRFLMGLGNGTMVVARTAISELAKGDKELESKGVGFLMSMVGYGMLFSPAVGGLLSEPMRQYPDQELLAHYFGDILTAFPFLLPNLVAFIMALFATFFVVVSVEETLPAEKRRHWGYAGSDLLQSILSTFQLCFPRRSEADSDSTTLASSSDDENNDDWDDDLKILDSQEFIATTTLMATRDSRASYTSALHRESTTSRLSADEQDGRKHHPNEGTPLIRKDPETDKREAADKETSIKSIMGKKSTRFFLITYWANTFASVSQSEAFPLFAMSKLGGLGLEESSIGLIGTFAGLLYCFAQYIVFTAAMKRFGLIQAMRLGAFWANVPVILIPVSLYLDGWLQIAYLSLVSGIMMTSNSVFFGCSTIGANRTVDASQRAAMNGINSLGTSIGRGSGPIFAGVLVAFSMTSGVFSPDVGGWVTYLVLTILGILSYLATWMIPDEE